MDADDSFTFGFNSQSLPYSSSCPSSSGSFSSASSLYDALTPPPRNSTPQHPMDFDIAFGNDSLMFDDFTPSPPSTSGCFPLDMKPTVAPNMLCHGLPMTPSRSNSSAAAFQNNVDFTPTQSMDAYNFMDPLMIPTPSPLFSNHIQNCDMTAIWQHHADGSPITFERTSSPAMAMTTPTPGPLGSSHGNIRRRIVMDGPQQKSALLQQSLPKTNSGKGRTPKAKQVAGKLPPLQEGFKVSKAPANRHRCEYPECNGKSYSRQEHLKRHYNEAHSDNPETWRCEFCETPKTFGRCDNFRDHLKRHIEKSAGSRTRHEIGAAILLAEMQSKMKNKKKTITRSTTPGTDDEMRSGDSLLSKSARSLVKAETS
ncbi:hypothetical protein F5883DRAFT_639360 [Diaporthe sp. PMI_573]|nr:hypothetical protein F5883DRAFT_639360 [Diaporthaceae sp. PMI_573]